MEHQTQGDLQAVPLKPKGIPSALGVACESVERAYADLTRAIVDDPANAENAALKHFVYCFDVQAERMLVHWIEEGQFQDFALALINQKQAVLSSAPKTITDLLVACRKDNVTNVARGIGVLPFEGLSVGGVGADVAL